MYLNHRLIWNPAILKHQSKYANLFNWLLIQSNQVLNRNFLTDNLTNKNQNEFSDANQINRENEGNPPVSNQNLIRKLTKKEKAQQTRLNELRSRLNNEQDLKKLRDFLNLNNQKSDIKSNESDTIIAKRRNPIPYLPEDFLDGNEQKVFIETYGCQMNVNDSQIVAKVLSNHNYDVTDKIGKAEIIFIMTCSIREGAETKIFERLKQLKFLKSNGNLKTVCLAGCMATRLKDKVLEQDRLVDIVIGPDNYRDLPNMLAINKLSGKNAVNVILSLDETYADVMPVIKIRNNMLENNFKITDGSNEKTNYDIELNNWFQFKENYAKKAFVSIMRGCDNMCSYCVVPYTRGRERSRPIETILNEIRLLSEAGVKEVTLLGQNVNSYRDYDQKSIELYKNSNVRHRKGFKTIYKKEKKGGVTFDVLLEQVALVDKNMRIRFTSPHPKDFTQEVIDVISKYPNICNHLHLPAQSGDDQVLSLMRRGYTVESYLQLVDAIRKKIPQITFTSDFICGFVGESEEAHQRTLELMRKVKYSFVYFYPYSVRENTFAHLHYKDDVPFDVKHRRTLEVGDLFREHALEINSSFIGKEQLILIEDSSRKNKYEVMFGRNESNIKVLVSIQDLEDRTVYTKDYRRFKEGDYVVARIDRATSQTLHGTPLYITNLDEYYSSRKNNENDQVEAVQSIQ